MYYVKRSVYHEIYRIKGCRYFQSILGPNTKHKGIFVFIKHLKGKDLFSLSWRLLMGVWKKETNPSHIFIPVRDIMIAVQVWQVSCSLRIRIRSDTVSLGHSDPDPGKYWNRILYLQKDPCNSKFLVIYNCLKYSYVSNVLSLILSVIRFGIKMPYIKIIYFAEHQKHI